MRMVQYYAGLALMTAAALLATLASGALVPGTIAHLSIGLLGAMLAVAAHTLCIVFMIVTGRVLREAMQARPLGDAFLARLNEFFGRKTAYPVAVLAAASIVAVGVLGYAHRGFGLDPLVHIGLGVAAILFNLWALQVEYTALRENQVLIDDAARALDDLDREAAARGEAPPVEDEPLDPARIRRGALVFAVSVWMPYLYWALVEWRGQFSRVSLHPWIELSAAGLLVALLAIRAERRAGDPADGGSGESAIGGEAPARR